jgi:hypothetical protein
VKIVNVVGVDPGLVHTGLVSFTFSPETSTLVVKHGVVDGLDADVAALKVGAMLDPYPMTIADIFIEWYRPRSGFSTNERMVQANADFKRALNGTLVKNAGVKKIVSKDLLKLVHADTFGTTTHHQDLRSAARIALLGMMLDPTLNRVLFNYAVDNVDGRDWHVRADT